MIDYDFIYKCLLVGDTNSGKSCLLNKICDDVYFPHHPPTVGIDFKINFYTIDDIIYKLQIWDTSGQERFRTITNAYYRGANMILLCFDVGCRETFNNVENWEIEIRRGVQDICPIFLIGTKSDTKRRQVLKEEAEYIAQKNGWMYIETSAKDDNKQTLIDNLIIPIISNTHCIHNLKSQLSIEAENPIKLIEGNNVEKQCC